MHCASKRMLFKYRSPMGHDYSAPTLFFSARLPIRTVDLKKRPASLLQPFAFSCRETYDDWPAC
jgi:hypothetical protein